MATGMRETYEAYGEAEDGGGEDEDDVSGEVEHQTADLGDDGEEA